MEKDRELRGKSENIASRREFLHQVAGAGLTAAAALSPSSGLAEPASRNLRTARGRSTSADRAVQPKVYHIVSAWAHPDYTQPPPRLVLTHDPSGKILLDEAAESKDGTKDTGGKDKRNQFWGVVHNNDDTMSITNSTGKYLSRSKTPDIDNTLTLQNRDEKEEVYGQTWRIGHVGDRDLILTPPILGVQYVVTAPYAKLEAGVLVPSPVTLKALFPPTDLEDTGNSWKFILAQVSGAKLDRAVQYHVLDSCDSTWHNPSCPGNRATWTGCVYDSTMMKCKCSHA